MKSPARWFCLAVLLCAGGATAGPRITEPTVDLPIRDVTVFSDRARVTRSAQIRLDKGTQTLALSLLPSTVDPSSVRVEATGAKVDRVEVKTATLDEFPKNEARKLIDQIDSLRDDIAGVEARLNTLRQGDGILRGLRPTATLKGDDRSPPATLDPAGWRASLQFIDAREAALADEMPALELQLKEKNEQLATLVEKANQIAAIDRAQNQIEVSAVIEGTGKPAEISLVYMATNAVWHPAYDVRYSPGDASVEVAYAALVAQQSGEDWTDAQLTFSTAVPLTTATLPQLSVWKIGERERFIPTPEAAYVAQAEVQAEGETTLESPAPANTPETTSDLRQRLMEAANAEEGAGRGMAATEAPKPVYKKSEQDARRAYMMRAARKRAEVEAAPTPPPAPPPPMAWTAAPASAMPVAESLSARSSPETPGEAVAFSSPRGWTPPAFAGDLPASLAGGYTFTYSSARAESIKNGGEVRRVPLFSRRFPATAFLKIQPALSKQAYLVAEVSNDGDRPLLGGQAHLFVGADLVGDAMVPTTAVGQKVTLPLGIDDAVRVERNVTTVESQRGVFSKQDVNAYQVDIELLNPRAKTVKARVIDQTPLSEQKEVEITLDKTDPSAVSAKTDGTVQWDLDLPTGTKKTLSFTYSVARPKNSRLSQHSAPAAEEH